MAFLYVLLRKISEEQHFPEARRRGCWAAWHLRWSLSKYPGAVEPGGSVSPIQLGRWGPTTCPALWSLLSQALFYFTTLGCEQQNSKERKKGRTKTTFFNIEFIWVTSGASGGEFRLQRLQHVTLGYLFLNCSLSVKRHTLNAQHIYRSFLSVRPCG